MEPENTEEASRGGGFTEEAHIIVTDGFEAVLFPSGLLLAQGDNLIRLDPASAMAIAGATMLAFASTDETPEEESESTPDS